MKKILAVLNQGHSLLNPMPQEQDLILLAVLNLYDNTLNMIDISHLPDDETETIENYLAELYEFPSMLHWIQLYGPECVWFHSEKQRWIRFPGFGEKKLVKHNGIT